MKSYILVWECNMWGNPYKLDQEYRKLNETRFNNCYHLADLYNSISNFLKTYEEFFFPEVIAIREA